VTFSEAMAGVAASTFKLKNTTTGAAIAAVVTRNGTSNQWILNPSATLTASTNFTVTVTGGTTAVRDLAGNPVATSIWRFTTGS
jgi:phosphoribosylformimino-5-aminoimidazole carboxamide ribonucleotide (ProFAR) isomerase